MYLQRLCASARCSGFRGARECTAGSRGFTLIELLVVIAIIAILAASSFRVRAREGVFPPLEVSGQSAPAWVALSLYADDHKSHYPTTETQNWPFGDWNDNRPTRGPRALAPYVKEDRLFFCPSNRFFKTPPYWKPNTYWCGYCYWGKYFTRNTNPPLDDTLVASRAGHQPMTLLMSDIIVTAAHGGSLTEDQVGWNSHNPKDPQGGNILYNDIHAKWKHFGEMKVFVKFTYSDPLVTFWY